MPERWFNPPYLPAVFTRPYDQPSWGAYFTDSHVLDGILGNIDVWGHWPWDFNSLVQNDVGSWQEHLLPILAGAGVKIGCGPTQGIFSVGDGVRIANLDKTNQIGRAISLGGTVDYIGHDGYPINFFYDVSTSPWPRKSTTQAQANTEMVNYLQTLHATYPNVKVGLDVNMPLWGWGGTSNWWGPAGTGNPVAVVEDYKACLESMVAAVNAVGEKLWYLQIDFPYSYMVGYKALANGTVRTLTDFWTLLLSMESWAKGLGLAFGVMCNSEEPGNLLDNARFYWESLDYYKQYIARGGNPDQILCPSWYDGPTELLPVEKPFTYSYLQRSMAAGKASRTSSGRTSISSVASARGRKEGQPVIPVWQLHLGSGNYIVTANMGERNSLLTNGAGWVLDGIAYFVPKDPTLP